MKNSPFRKLFVRGLTVLIFISLFIFLIILNVVNIIIDNIEDRKRNEPKVHEITITEFKEETPFKERKVDTPKTKVIYKPIEKVIDTPKLVKPNDSIEHIDSTILKK